MILYNQSNAFLKISSYHLSLLQWGSVRFFFALDSMTLLDRFLFNEAVEDTQTYNDMIEILLENQVHLIPWTETEKELRVSPELRSIRLDVISMDEAGELYQMEIIQRIFPKNFWIL